MQRWSKMCKKWKQWSESWLSTHVKILWSDPHLHWGITFLSLRVPLKKPFLFPALSLRERCSYSPSLLMLINSLRSWKSVFRTKDGTSSSQNAFLKDLLEGPLTLRYIFVSFTHIGEGKMLCELLWMSLWKEEMLLGHSLTGRKKEAKKGRVCKMREQVRANADATPCVAR